MSNAKDIIATAAMDEQAEVSWPVLLAKKHAIDASKQPFPDSYVTDAHRPEWAPHDWVINAIREAHGMGMLDGRANGNAVAEAQAEQHDIERQGIVRAVLAKLLESFVDAKNKTPSVTFNPQDIATVWDRVDLDFKLNEDGSGTYTLYPAARKPDGAA